MRMEVAKWKWEGMGIKVFLQIPISVLLNVYGVIAVIFRCCSSIINAKKEGMSERRDSFKQYQRTLCAVSDAQNALGMHIP